MVIDVPGETECGAFDQRAHRRDIAQADLGHFAVDLGDRAAHQALARLADALVAVGFDGDAVGQLARFLGRHRAAEDVALDLADAELADQVEIVVRLDALGGGVHAQAFGQRDDGADDRAVAVGGRRGAAHEALVDLDLVERRLLQIAERAVAGAEIVERQPDAELLQLGEGLVGAVAFGEEHALGDLELEPRGANARLLAAAAATMSTIAGSLNWIGDRLTAIADLVGPVRRFLERGLRAPIRRSWRSGRILRRAG